MSRKQIDWDKAKRDEKGRNSLNPLAFEDSRQVYLQQLAQGQELKPLLKERVSLSKAAIHCKARQSALRLVSDSKLLVVDRTIQRDGTACCFCNLEFEYHYPGSLDAVDLLREVLKAKWVLTGSRGVLLFHFEHPQHKVML